VSTRGVGIGTVLSSAGTGGGGGGGGIGDSWRLSDLVSCTVNGLERIVSSGYG
jgi:hypothetical protein